MDIVLRLASLCLELAELGVAALADLAGASPRVLSRTDNCLLPETCKPCRMEMTAHSSPQAWHRLVLWQPYVRKTAAACLTSLA